MLTVFLWLPAALNMVSYSHKRTNRSHSTLMLLPGLFLLDAFNWSVLILNCVCLCLCRLQVCWGCCGASACCLVSSATVSWSQCRLTLWLFMVSSSSSSSTPSRHATTSHAFGCSNSWYYYPVDIETWCLSLRLSITGKSILRTCFVRKVLNK